MVVLAAADIAEHESEISRRREAKLTLLKAPWVAGGGQEKNWPYRYQEFSIEHPIDPTSLYGAMTKLGVTAEASDQTGKVLVYQRNVPKAHKELFEVNMEKKHSKIRLLEAPWEASNDFYSLDASGKQKTEIPAALQNLDISFSQPEGVIKVNKKSIDERFKTLFEAASESKAVGAERA